MPGRSEIAERPSSPIYEALMALKPEGMSLNAWAKQAGINRSIFNGIRAHGNPTSDTLQKLLDAIGVSLSDLYARMEPNSSATVLTEVRGTGMNAHDIERAWHGPQPSRPVPLLGTAFGGEWSDGVEMTELHLTDVLDYVGRPQAVAGDRHAYAVEFVGDSMVPRYEPGERAIVSPRAQVRPGDDVIVQLKTAAPVEDEDRIPDPDHMNRVTMVLVKRLVRQTARYVELQQYNPEMTFQVPAERVAAVHRVMARF
jgi:SOS-response transcriptional repressor LexA